MLKKEVYYEHSNFKQHLKSLITVNHLKKVKLTAIVALLILKFECIEQKCRQSMVKG